MSMLICIVLEIFTSLYWLINVVWPLVGCCTFELRIYENENSLYVCHTAWKWKKSVHMYTCIKCKQLVFDFFVKHTSKCYIRQWRSDSIEGGLLQNFYLCCFLTLNFIIWLFYIGVGQKWNYQERPFVCIFHSVILCSFTYSLLMIEVRLMILWVEK